jgi:hypothetical protein
MINTNTVLDPLSAMVIDMDVMYACFAGAKTGHSLYQNKHQYRTGNCGVHSAKQHGNTACLLQRRAVFWVGSS